jgi:hypothetical protein
VLITEINNYFVIFHVTNNLQASVPTILGISSIKLLLRTTIPATILVILLGKYN